VKITGSTPLPLLPHEEALLSPDPVTSVSAIKLDPIDSTLFPCPREDGMATLLTDEEENEAEFGEFLLDAVDWL
jgi:hypothetical protein